MKHTFLKYCRLVLLVLILPVSLQAVEAPVEISTGTIEGAHYTIAKPSSWQGQLLIVAHGHRPEATELDGSLDIERPVYANLMAEGWMIAITSYRRNGIIVNDAVEDLDLLRHHIVQIYGQPARTLIMGDSMGGAIGALIAETRYRDYDGILAIGAALDVRDRHDPIALNHSPQIPILFLTNQSELQGPRDYVSRAASAPVAPALWRVSRDGHVNVNDAERLAALYALDQFVETGQIDRDKDSTIAGKFVQSSANFSTDGAHATITSISANYGNIFTGFVAQDLQRLGINSGSHFKLSLREKTVRVLWGINYGDVKQGDWVAFISAEGNLMIARNSLNACTAIGCKVGDQLFLYP